MRRNKYMIVMVTGLILTAGTLFAISGCSKNASTAKTGHGKVMYHCPMHPTYVSDKPGDCPICGMKLVKVESKPEEKPANSMQNVTAPNTASAGGKKERKLLYYRNPMNPQATSPVPTKDSMGMDYVPVYKEEKGEEAVGPTITISPEKQQLIGVKTEAVKKMELTKVVRASGKIAYDPELVVTQEEFIQAFKNEENAKDSPLSDVIERAKSMTEAARHKLKLLGMSDDQIAELANTKKAQTNLYLPGKGESVWAYISIYEYEIGLVHPGDTVDIEAVAYPGEKFGGTVKSINPVLDSATRTNQVRVEVANPGNELKPEMFINAQIKVSLGEKLAVPESAVLDTGLRKIVYLSEENNTLESREITIGQKAEGYYEVMEGLKEGDIVITSGNFLIDSESRLKNASQGAEQK